MQGPLLQAGAVQDLAVSPSAPALAGDCEEPKLFLACTWQNTFSSGRVLL